MAQYIDKSTVVAEINRVVNSYDPTNEITSGRYALVRLRNFIETLEVREVDLEKELNDWRHNHFHGRRDKDANGEWLERISQLELAKHFFELGLKASNPLTWEDIDWIVGEAVCKTSDNWSTEQICKEVLKRFKAQKGKRV